jgi:hypothetical protein
VEMNHERSNRGRLFEWHACNDREVRVFLAEGRQQAPPGEDQMRSDCL